jgi:hypothetical protein
MHDYMTPEFIDLCRKIQDEIEPEDAQCMWAKPEDKKGVYPVRYPVYYQGTGSDYVLVGVRRSYGQDQIILLPDLGWLVRKLETLGLPEVGQDKHGYYCYVEERQRNDGRNTTANFLQGATTPELACLKALLKIKEVS